MQPKESQHQDVHVTRGQVIRYMVLPGILPRIEELFVGSFSYVAFLMGHIYGMVRLLPPEHPYLNPANMGKFGVRNVMAQAARNLRYDTKHLDQIFVFLALLLGLVLLILQIALLLYSLLMGAAFAAAPSMLFSTPDPSGGEVKDIAFLLLDKVFGIPDFFCTVGGTCTSTGASSVTPFQEALHDLFQYYSLAILMVAVFLFLYFLVVVTVETAQTGTPFGQRFQNVFVPIRLVVAVGLLLPLNYGFSTGQYIAFYAAKMGSGMATNGWNTYNDAVIGAADGSTAAGQNPTGEKETLIPKPSSPEYTPVIYAMSLVQTCAYAYQRAHNLEAEPGTSVNAYKVQPYQIRGQESQDMPADIRDAFEYSGGEDIIIRFGVKDDSYEGKYVGGVEPTCGDIRIPLHSAGIVEEGGTPSLDDPLSSLAAGHYFNIITLWYDEDLNAMAKRMTEIYMRRDENKLKDACKYGAGNEYLDNGDNCHQSYPKVKLKSDVSAFYMNMQEKRLRRAWNEMAEAANFDFSDEVKDRGWAGAGIWYNQIATINGPFVASNLDIPSLQKYPMAMLAARNVVRANNKDVASEDEFCPTVVNGRYEYNKDDLRTIDRDMAMVLCQVHRFWLKDGGGDMNTEKSVTANPLKNIVGMMLGTSGLFDMRNENAYAHPMAQLVALGKGFVESAMRNLAFSSAAAFMGGLSEIFGPQMSKMIGGIGGLLNSTAFLGLTAGFILFYVIPFMPFLYVFFAAGGWVKGLFEAMVGIPLWALAHMRLDGEGLPPQTAENGYFLIFDIFLRPILVVFGLIAAITIFSVEVRVLNYIWDLVLVNVGGFNSASHGTTMLGEEFRRSSVDQFFFTIIYVMVVYMMANGSFKLIDSIPKSILRWAGTGISAFGDINQDPKGITQYAAMGGITVGRQLVTSVEQFAGGTGGALNTMLTSDKKVNQGATTQPPTQPPTTPPTTTPKGQGK